MLLKRHQSNKVPLEELWSTTGTSLTLRAQGRPAQVRVKKLDGINSTAQRLRVGFLKDYHLPCSPTCASAYVKHTHTHMHNHTHTHNHTQQTPNKAAHKKSLLDSTNKGGGALSDYGWCANWSHQDFRRTRPMQQSSHRLPLSSNSTQATQVHHQGRPHQSD